MRNPVSKALYKRGHADVSTPTGSARHTCLVLLGKRSKDNIQFAIVPIRYAKDLVIRAQKTKEKVLEVVTTVYADIPLIREWIEKEHKHECFKVVSWKALN